MNSTHLYVCTYLVVFDDLGEIGDELAQHGDDGFQIFDLDVLDFADEGERCVEL